MICYFAIVFSCYDNKNLQLKAISSRPKSINKKSNKIYKTCWKLLPDLFWILMRFCPLFVLCKWLKPTMWSWRDLMLKRNIKIASLLLVGCKYYTFRTRLIGVWMKWQTTSTKLELLLIRETSAVMYECWFHKKRLVCTEAWCGQFGEHMVQDRLKLNVSVEPIWEMVQKINSFVACESPNSL